jgi:hypothetical protein
MKVKKVVTTDGDIAIPGLALGDKGNVWFFTGPKSGFVVGSLTDAVKPKPVGYSSDRLVPSKFEPIKRVGLRAA